MLKAEDKIDIARFYINKEMDDFQTMLADEFDDNYFGDGSITLMGNEVDVESIWTDDDNNINIHVNHPEFEGDILMVSLSKENQLKVIDIIIKKKGIEL